MSNIPTTGYLSTGYTCGQCGQWVTNGIAHLCNGLTNVQQQWTWPPVDTQVVNELKAIHETLRAILKRLSL